MVVKASVWPPMASMLSAISDAVFVSVPLKTMCSMKWETPLSRFRSYREPVATQIPAVTERTLGTFSHRIRTPLGRTAFSTISVPFPVLLHAFRLKTKLKIKRMEV